MSIGIIGVGQGGSAVASEFSKRGVPSIVMNYSESDLNSVSESVQGKLRLIGSDGVGKNRGLATQLMSNNYETAISFVKEHFSQPSTELIFVIFSCAGGTGSGCSPLLLELLQNEMEDKVFVAVPILPTLSEVIVNQSNALDTLSQLSNLNVCIVPLDNSKWIQEGGKNQLYKNVNESFVELIINLMEYTEKHSQYSNLDKKDLLTLFSTKGFSTIGCTDLTKLRSEGVSMDREGIQQLIKQSWDNSIFTSPSYEKVVRVGLIFDGQENLLQQMDQSLIFNHFPNQPIDFFEGYFTESRGLVYTVLTGLKFNNKRLEEIRQIIQQQNQMLESLNHETTISVQATTIQLRNNPQKKKKALDILGKYKK